MRTTALVVFLLWAGCSLTVCIMGRIAGRAPTADEGLQAVNVRERRRRSANADRWQRISDTEPIERSMPFSVRL